ncbi:MAG: guanylate kinase [bacterium]
MKLDLRNEESIAFIISAPSGVGKTTIRKELALQAKDLRYSVSYTTRPPRTGEIDGQDYHFVTREVFQEEIKKDSFLEWAQVHQHFYGTPADPIMAAMDGKNDILLDVDVQGAYALQRKLQGAVFIFLLPPSWKVLEERLRNRRTETEQEISERLATARREIQRCYDYDYLIVNNELEETVHTLKSIMSTEHCRPARMKSALQKIW